MKHLLLPLLLAISSIAHAQFRPDIDKPEQLGISTGLCYWNSNFRNNISALGIDEAVFYRKEYRRLALQVALDYSTYQHPLHYYALLLDAPAGHDVDAYDRTKLNIYSTVVALQYKLYSTDQFRLFLGIYTDLCFYYYNIHSVPGYQSENKSGNGGLHLGGGLSWFCEYKLYQRWYANVQFSVGYLKQSDLAPDDEIYDVPEFKESLLFGLAYKL
ncbi:MAG: hypothetical protein ACTHJ0_13675 [Flavipsychrobacter sp.]